MSSLSSQLATLLGTVRRPGDFCASGAKEILAPVIEVDGVGPVALPLLPVQAEQLVAAAERAPYGRGEETLLDTAVRRTWQIDAARIHIGGRHWPQTLEQIVSRAAEGLGVDGPVEAELYKLLIYAEGDFFVSHRDTEKAPGMFATLVIVLPSAGASAGGELIVRHKGREVRLDLNPEDPSEVRFAAFYADCVHEVTPVTRGHRLTLIYNLMRRAAGALPEPPDYDRETARVAALLKDWAEATGQPEDPRPDKLVYPLEHAYTQAELGFGTLKGADAAMAGVVAAAARQADCTLHLALVSIEEHGAAEYAYSGRSYRHDWSDTDFEAGEVFDRIVSLTEWRRPDGGAVALADLPFDEIEELSPPEAFDDLEPDEEEFQEATGNAGATFDRFYRRAALVLWPNTRFLTVLSDAGLPVAVPYLEDLTGRWAAAGGKAEPSPSDPLWNQAHDLAGLIVADWPDWPDWYRYDDTRSGFATRLLTSLIRLGDTEIIAAFFDRLAEGKRFGKGDNAALVEAAGLLPPESSATLIGRIIRAHAPSSVAACADLLALAAMARPPGLRADLADAGEALVAALPGDPAQVPLDSYGRPMPVQATPRFVVDVLTGLTGLTAIDDGLAMRAADHMLAWPTVHNMDAVLVPAVLDLAGAAATRHHPAVERLRAAVLAHLRARIAEPLEAPQDWRRDSRLPCSCPNCRDLAGFLDDPAQKIWILKAVAHDREHVEDTIRRAGSDLDTRTDRKGRPYSLICTKNQASYERRVEQRRQDLETVARLEG